MSKSKKVLFTCIATIALPFLTFGADKTPEIRFIDYYDQLVPLQGQQGHWFVRDAGNTTTGQHGDPTVKKGWAMYTWDARGVHGKACWRKIASEESLVDKGQDLSDFVTKDTFAARTTEIEGEIGQVKNYATDKSEDAYARAIRAAAEYDFQVLNAAKKYHDEHPSGGGGDVTSNDVKNIARQLDDGVKAQANAYTDLKLSEKERTFYDVIKAGYDLLFGKKVAFGAGAAVTTNDQHKGTININPVEAYPNIVGTGHSNPDKNGYNIGIGYDLKVGTEGGEPRYSVAIGTSATAARIHSYAWGSQISALEEQTTVMGYGLSATHHRSTVIGQGNRTIYEKTFNTVEQMRAYFSDLNNVSQWYKDFGVLVSTGPGASHVVTEILSSPDPETGMYVKLLENPPDYIAGQHYWYYGKSHGPGTFNIVAVPDPRGDDPGLRGVFINDWSLYDRIFEDPDSPTATVMARDGTMFAVSNFNAKTGKWVVENIKDFGVRIGSNARGTGNSGTHNQEVVIGRDARASGAAATALGPNSEADGAQAIAVGWRAMAIGAHSVAIGSGVTSGQNYWTDDTRTNKNEKANGTLAEGDQTIAIGYGAHAKAARSIQLGKGTNTVANSVQINDTTIFKDGKLVGIGGVETNAVKDIARDVANAQIDVALTDKSKFDPVKVTIPPSAVEEELVITCMPHVVNTAIASTNMSEGTELYLEPAGSRNFEVFIPNTEKFRAGLPLGADTDIDGVTAVFMNDKTQVFKLPAMLKIQQPTEDVVVLTLSELTDKFDWKPVVTKSNIKFNPLKGQFYTDGQYALEGKALHGATAFKIVYPTSKTTAVTNDIETVNSKGIIDGTFFYHTSRADYTPPTSQKIYIDVNKSWFEIIYSTQFGTVNLPRQEIDVLAL